MAGFYDDEDEGARRSLPRRLRWLALGVGVFVLAWLLVIGGNSLARYTGWIVSPASPKILAETLRPYYRIAKPAGDGPFPTALLFSGCDGPHDNLERWSEMLNGMGWAAVIVDSHAPRGYLDFDVWRLICAGQILMGSERAGDVLVSFYDVRRQPWVDPDRMAVIGGSHGGWAILELLVFEKLWRLPYNLAALPEDDVEHPLQGLRAAILLYPYCGAANRAQRIGWRYDVPVLFLLAERDMIAPAADCLRLAERAAADGLPVETHLFPGIDHGFDQEEREPLSTLRFEPEATAEALSLGRAFLERASAPREPGAEGSQVGTASN